MAAEYDVGARLAEARPTVGDIAEYVQACQVLGHRQPDLSGDGVQQWYGSEDGMQLPAIERDAAALTALAGAADDAVRAQAYLMNTLSDAWAGQGADAARDFLTRHQQASASVVAAVRRAADALTALRADLWEIVDAKVDATLAIAATREGQWPGWLAAARTVTSGAGDRATASELVDLEVKPFVDNDIGVRWVDAMRSTRQAIAATYDGTADVVRSGGETVFDVPGELGPRWSGSNAPRPAGGDPTETVPTVAAVPSPAVPAAGSGGGAAAAVTPSAFAAPPPVAPVPLASAPAPPAQDALPVAPQSVPPMPSSPLGGLGGGGSSLGSGLPGFGQQLADLIGGLVGAGEGDDLGSAELEPPDLDDPIGDDEPSEVDEAGDAADEDEDAADEDEDETEVVDSAADPPGPEGPTEAAAEPPPEPTPTPVPPPPELSPPPPSPEPMAEPAEQTPCEIAADELPQVGE